MIRDAEQKGKQQPKSPRKGERDVLQVIQKVFDDNASATVPSMEAYAARARLPRRVFHSIDFSKAATHYPAESQNLEDERLEGAVHAFLKTNVNQFQDGSQVTSEGVQADQS